MKFISTRDSKFSCGASQAIAQGLAADGGLFVPQSWPIVKIEPPWVKLPFFEFAAKVITPFFESDPLKDKIKEICRQAFNFDLPLTKISPDTYMLELFHGPTGAFKDFGARFLALCVNAIPSTNKRRLVMVATSGDTGGAVAAAFCQNTEIPVIILFPKDKISLRQQKQLTTWGTQVQAYAVQGSFDDCQNLVKQAFASDLWKQRHELISANSINIARLLPQIAYFAYASLHYKSTHGVAAGMVIPSGNVGNSIAALWAQKLGFPIRKVIFAHNANSTVQKYFESGVWEPKPTVSTLANAMDVGNPSNFERVRHLFPNINELRKVASAISVSDDKIKETIMSGKKQFRQIWCPHTATAAFARQEQTDGHWIIVATAHPAKFETVIEPLIQEKIQIPDQLKELLNKPSTFTEIPPTLSAVADKDE